MLVFPILLSRTTSIRLLKTIVSAITYFFRVGWRLIGQLRQPSRTCWARRFGFLPITISLVLSEWRCWQWKKWTRVADRPASEALTLGIEDMSFPRLNARNVPISVRFIRSFLRVRPRSFTVHAAVNMIAQKRKSSVSHQKSHGFLMSATKL